MSGPTHYPPSPSNVPEGITRAKGSYKRQAWLAMLGLLSFIVIYLALTAGFAFVAYNNLLKISAGNDNLFLIFITGISIILTVFLLKSLFTVRKFGEPGGIEVMAEEEPKLFDFLHRLADEIGAPKPHRVFITPEVNAAVFYDLSLFNLIFPSKKNLIIGLGLVNVLNLGELKAVLAHEFGHFAQGAMAVGRWVYVAQQIIEHMVATRDWLDNIIRFISRIDLRVAWVGWLLGLIIWSIRSLMDTLFRVVVIAERALSREMEFNADLVAVSVTGSDALVNALHKLQAADEALQTALNVAESEASKGKRITDLFNAQQKAIESIRHILNDEDYGLVPEAKGGEPSQHRVFSEQTAAPPQMWSTHPANRDREDNAKSTYISAEIDKRPSWNVFSDPDKLRQDLQRGFYNSETVDELEEVMAEEAVAKRFDKAALSPEYRGTYLSRSPVRNFSSIDDLFQSSNLSAINNESLSTLYPTSLAEQLESARTLDSERYTLQALQSGALKPSGGVIRHRGQELKKNDIPKAIEDVAQERKAIGEQLKKHDANCRQAHLLAAKQIGHGWADYLLGLTTLLHCTEHLAAIVNNEQALLVNTWQVITADGQIGYFEKKRMIKVCKQVQTKLREVSSVAEQISLPESIAEETGIENRVEQFPRFEIDDVTKGNWAEWCEVASEVMGNLSYALELVESAALEALIKSESKVAQYYENNEEPDAPPAAGSCPAAYPVLLPGDEHVLQQKLDLWNRFQLAHGVMPTLLRLLVSLSIVGGTIYSGIIRF